MTVRWPSRLAVNLGSGTLAVVAAAGTAWANSTIDLMPDQLPATASTAHASGDCTDLVDAASYSDNDLWLFRLDGANAGDFMNVTLTFAGPDGGADERVIEAGDADGDDIVDGVDIAWIATPAGWTLTGATAEITGFAEHFVLALTCPAPLGGQPVPVSQSSTGPIVASVLERGTKGAARTLRPSVTQNGAPAGLGVTAAVDESLASTGQDIGGMLILGTTLVTSGALLLIVRRGRAHRGVHRRRRGSAIRPTSRPDLDVVETYPPLGSLEIDRRPAVVTRRTP